MKIEKIEVFIETFFIMVFVSAFIFGLPLLWIAISMIRAKGIF